MDKQTYILFRRTGQNISTHRGPLYQARSIHHLTRQEAAEQIFSWAMNDHGVWPDDDARTYPGIIDTEGQLWYEHDGRTYELVSGNQMDQEQRAAYERDLNY